MTAVVKTYFLAPNFNFRPGGAITLGNIIVDPFRPQRVLTRPDPNKPLPETQTTTDLDCNFHRKAGQGVNMTLWARFLETVGLGLGFSVSSDKLTKYEMASLETCCFTHELSEDEVRERTHEATVRNVLSAGGLTRARAVYMITGVKVAKGLVTTIEKNSGASSKLDAGFSLGEGATAGGEAGWSRDSEERDTVRSGDDVVFA